MNFEEWEYSQAREYARETLLFSWKRFEAKTDLSKIFGVRIVTNSKDAVLQAIDGAAPEELILVTGSSYLVGEVRTLWHPKVEFLVDSLTSDVPKVLSSDAAIPAKPPLEDVGQTLSP